MKIFKVRNCCEALPKVVEFLSSCGRQEDSRNGPVLVAPTPVMTIYSYPTEKVLFSGLRDANPFFHIMEAMWMLNGNNDARFLDHYVKDFSERFAEPSSTTRRRIHGAYGHRWRSKFGFDQLKEITDRLKDDPLDRQCVLQMWDAQWEDGGSDDLTGKWRERPCNTHVYFRINDGKLDMTTMARSHDALFGAVGANIVHFGFLQEYLAGGIGVPVGVFYQYSNNYHMYLDVYNKYLNKSQGDDDLRYKELYDNRYATQDALHIPLVSHPETFDRELMDLIDAIDCVQNDRLIPLDSKSPKMNGFLWSTVLEMSIVHKTYKTKGVEAALHCVANIEDKIWQLCAKEWLERRVK